MTCHAVQLLRCITDSCLDIPNPSWRSSICSVHYHHHAPAFPHIPHSIRTTSRYPRRLIANPPGPTANPQLAQSRDPLFTRPTSVHDHRSPPKTHQLASTGCYHHPFISSTALLPGYIGQLGPGCSVSRREIQRNGPGWLLTVSACIHFEAYPFSI
jgi:hypothetical protein